MPKDLVPSALRRFRQERERVELRRSAIPTLRCLMFWLAQGKINTKDLKEVPVKRFDGSRMFWMSLGCSLYYERAVRKAIQPC